MTNTDDIDVALLRQKISTLETHLTEAERQRDALAALATDANTGWATALDERDAALALLRRIYARDLIGWSDPLSREVYELLRRKP